MGEATTQIEVSPLPLDARPVRTATLQDDRRFGVALAVAIAAHALLFTSFNAASPRRLGDPSGIDDAVSVALVTEADLRGRATVDDKGPGSPMPQPSPAPAVPPPPATPAPTEAQDTPAVPPPPAAATPQPEALTLPGSGLKPPQQSKQPAAEPKEPTKSEPAKSESTAKRRQAATQQMRTAKLDLTPPPSVFSAPDGGGGAGVERPPGITRSGENDAFARGVIRALQRTMPQLRNTYGRVTVRITLDLNGSLVSTQVVKPSNVAGLDQNVVFATKQTSFPFPPRNANSADLIFIVTYIYR